MYALGVDLGTVFTAAATWRNGHAEISSLGSRAATIPSVVLLREDASILTGEAANRRALLEPGRVAREFKRRFGDATPILLGGTPYSAESLMARLLKSVVSQVASQQGGPPGAMCLCHPANWGPYKIDLLQQAVRMAELDVPVSFAVEPAAAAAYYARQQRLDPGALVAVYDLGGGTFDAAVLRKTEAGFEIMGRPEGIEHLGGADFDAAVFQHVRGVVGDELDALDDALPSSVAAVARLREECTSAKETLSSDTDTTIPVLLPNLATEVRITRAELETMVRPLLYDTISALQRAIRSAGVNAADLHSVLLIGGSSRMPLVAQLVGAELNRPVAVDAHPKHAVALGAAWVAGEQLADDPAPGRPAAAPYSPSRSESGNGRSVSSAPATPAASSAPAAASSAPAAPAAAGLFAASVAGTTPGLETPLDPDQTRRSPTPPPGQAYPPPVTPSSIAPAQTARPSTTGAAAGAAAGAGLAGAGQSSSASLFTANGAPDAPAVYPPPGRFELLGQPPAHQQPLPAGYPGGPAQPHQQAPHQQAPHQQAPQQQAPQQQAPQPPPHWAGTGTPHPFAGGEATRRQPFWAKQGVIAATAAAAAVILLVALGGYVAGRSGLFGGAAAAQKPPSTPAIGGADATGPVAQTSTGSGASGSAASTSTTPIIYQCPTSATVPLYACIASVKALPGTKLQIDYTVNFSPSTIQDDKHNHLHFFLANPSADGTATVPADNLIQHVPGQGSWFSIFDKNVKVIDNTTSRGGEKAGIDTAKYKLLCVRVAVGLHALVKDTSGGFRSGNCAPITS